MVDLDKVIYRCISKKKLLVQRGDILRYTDINISRWLCCQVRVLLVFLLAHFYKMNGADYGASKGKLKFGYADL